MRLNRAGLRAAPEDAEPFVNKMGRDCSEFPPALLSALPVLSSAEKTSLHRSVIPPALAHLQKQHHLSCVNDAFSSKVFIHGDNWQGKEVVSSRPPPHLSVFSLPRSFGIPVGNDQNITSVCTTSDWEAAVKKGVRK